MAFSGVRSSWLMLARNSLLALLAPSARIFSSSYLRASSASSSWLRSSPSTARLRAASFCFTAVMSAAVITIPPSAVGRSDTWIQRPSRSSASYTSLAPDGAGWVSLMAILGEALHALAQGADLEQARVQREHRGVGAVAHQQAAVAVPQDEGFRHALDGVAQAVLGSLGAGLGQALLGHVERHADDALEAAAGGVAITLAPRVDPGQVALLAGAWKDTSELTPRGRRWPGPGVRFRGDRRRSGPARPGPRPRRRRPSLGSCR